MKLDQYFTPAWAAELLVKRHYPGLGDQDLVIEPSCGDGRFLMAIPDNVQAIGVEIDPLQAEKAVHNSGREVLVGDFREINLPAKPTVVIGNPPFQSDLIDDFLERCYELLEYEGRVGFLLPVYYLQTASKVVSINRRYSIDQELLPRNLFSRMTKPLMWCNFTKARKTVLSGFFLYAETASVLTDMHPEIRELMIGNESRAKCWREVVSAALGHCGGTASLSQLYACIEGNRPTDNPWWREKVRQVAGKHFHRVAPGQYSLSELRDCA